MCQLPESVTVTGFSPFKGKKKKERNLKEVLFVPEQLQAPPLILGWPTAAPLVGCIPTLSEAGPLQPSCLAPPEPSSAHQATGAARRGGAVS